MPPRCKYVALIPLTSLSRKNSQEKPTQSEVSCSEKKQYERLFVLEIEYLKINIFCWRVLEPGARSTFGNILPQFSHKGRKYSLVEAIMGWAYLAGYELQLERKPPNL